MTATGAIDSCPACGADYSVAPVREGSTWRLPSMRLEIVPAIRDRPSEWQLSTFPGAGQRPIRRSSEGYHQHVVRSVYHLCGDGHVFLAGPGPAQPGPDSWRIEHWNMLAAVGSVASGKSYLLVRTLAQQLKGRSRRRPEARTAARYETRYPDPVEDIPGLLLQSAYARTRSEGVQMGPTTLDELLPAVMLGRVDDRLPGAVRQIHLELLELTGSDPVPPEIEGWGLRIRQPVVLRTELTSKRGRHHVWTGVSDLAGESMALQRIEDRDQERLLRGLDGLIWVVDPAVSTRLTTLVQRAVHDATSRRGPFIEASIRMDPGVDVRGTQTDRETKQADLRSQLTSGQGPLRRDGGRSRLLVVVNKADLFRTALTAGDFDLAAARPGAMLEGVEQYMHHVLERSGRNVDSATARVRPSPRLAVELDRLRAGEDAVREKLVRQLAEGLVEHYAGPDRFWQLVQDGDGAAVPLEPGANHQVPGATFTVPSLDDHITDSLQPGASAYLQARDLVMSALGCGLMFVLGHGEQVDDLMSQPAIDLHFFVCSPLEHIPTQTGSGSSGFAPLDPAAVFPTRNATSAGLSQLLLAIQYGARS